MVYVLSIREREGALTGRAEFFCKLTPLDHSPDGQVPGGGVRLHSHRRAGRDLQAIAQQNCELALERIGAAPEKVLHVAESLFHDHVPAKGMGIDTAWIHRRAAKGGFGGTPPAEVEPDLEVPDLEPLVHALGLRGL